ncbi:STAS/SEC14 domain-containing protein [bacterium]|nr:STAS/SEC14 domain-containing protein [bacterium]
MFRQIEGLPADVLAVEATGEVSHADYRDWLIPRAEAMMGKGPVRMLYVLGAGFAGFDLRAMADDARFGQRHLHDFSRIAFVSDHGALNAIVTVFRPFFHGEVKVFALHDLEKARAWIAEGAHVG